MENQSSQQRRRTRKKYSREEKQRHIRAQEVSGQSAAAYCREHEVKYGNFLRWQQKEVKCGNALQAVELVTESERGEVVAEIRFGNGQVLLVQSGCSEKLAMGLAKILL